MTTRPLRCEAAEYYFTYIDKVPDGDIRRILEAQSRDTGTSHIDEFRAVRAATVTFFATLPADAWDRRGIASDNPFSVRALPYITAGHVVHHIGLLKERYL